MNLDDAKTALQAASKTIAKQNEVLERLTSAPFFIGTVVRLSQTKAPRAVDYRHLKLGTEIRTNNRYDDRDYRNQKAVIDRRDDEDGRYVVKFVKDGNREYMPMPSKMNGADRVFELLETPGSQSTVTVQFEGKRVEVLRPKNFMLNVGDTVHLHHQTMQIIAIGDLFDTGDVATVVAILADGQVEVSFRDEIRTVLPGRCPTGLSIDDRVVLDSSLSIILRNLGKKENRFLVNQATNVAWSDIGGLYDAKLEMIEVIESPAQDPALFRHYHKKPVKGVLLYGPPGNGKTMLGKAAATALAKIHAGQNGSTGFFYIKGPEILDRWVGSSEAVIRQLFRQAKRFKESHGYPAVIFIDEADSILRKRGTGVSSDVESTIVPMFLVEMDGLEDSGAMVILATNRPDILDPAITRDGRIDRKIYIERPSKETAAEIFKLHLRRIPLNRGVSIGQAAKHVANVLFADQFTLYEVSLNGKHKGQTMRFQLSHLASGAMIAGVVDQATSIALRRDKKQRRKSGIRLDDLSTAVQRVFEQSRPLNHTDELQEFVHDVREDVVGIRKLRQAA